MGEYVYKTTPARVHPAVIKLDSGETIRALVGVYVYAYKPSRGFFSDVNVEAWRKHIAPAERAFVKAGAQVPQYGVIAEKRVNRLYVGRPVYKTGLVGVVDDVAFDQRAGWIVSQEEL